MMNWYRCTPIVVTAIVAASGCQLAVTRGAASSEQPQVRPGEAMKLQMYLKTTGKRGLRRDRVIISLWSSGLLVWDSSFGGDPSYCSVWLTPAEQDRVMRTMEDLAII